MLSPIPACKPQSGIRNTSKPMPRLTLGLLSLALCLVAVNSSAAAASPEPASAWVWNFLIASFVLAVTAASAVLPYSAVRKWQAGWRIAAAAPLVVLFLWLILIVASKALGTGSHELWPLEVFAWAMLNMIYMVAAMTVKRIFARADEDTSVSD